MEAGGREVKEDQRKTTEDGGGEVKEAQREGMVAAAFRVFERARKIRVRAKKMRARAAVRVSE